MAEGNAAVFDYTAIRAALREKGYRPIYHTAESEAKAAAEPLVCPDSGPCRLECGPNVQGCRVHKMRNQVP